MNSIYRITCILTIVGLSLGYRATAQMNDSIKHADFLRACELFKDSLGKYKVVEDYDVDPQPMGGSKGYIYYLRDNFKYPMIDYDTEIKAATMYFTLLIDTAGNIVDVKVKKDPTGCSPLKDEGLRVLKKMPRWTPAVKNGKPVNCLYTIPIKVLLR